MSKLQRHLGGISIALLAALLAVILYAFVFLPNQQKAQRLESYRSELNETTRIGTDLCGDRLNHKDSAIFNHTRDTFRMHQGMLLAQYNMAYDDMMSYDTPNARLLLGEYCAVRDIPTDYTAYAPDSDDTTGHFICLCTNIVYDALGNDSRSMEAVLKEIEADERTQEAIELIS